MPAPAAHAANSVTSSLETAGHRPAVLLCIATRRIFNAEFSCCLNQKFRAAFSRNIHSTAIVAPHTLADLGTEERSRALISGRLRHDAPRPLQGVFRVPSC